MFLQAYGARVPAIILFPLPPRHIWVHRERFTQWASISWAQHWGICNKLQCCWPHLPSAWLDRSLIQLLLAHEVWEQNKGCRATPQLKTHYLVVFQAWRIPVLSAPVQPPSLTSLGSHGPSPNRWLEVPLRNWHNGDVMSGLFLAGLISLSTTLY